MLKIQFVNIVTNNFDRLVEEDECHFIVRSPYHSEFAKIDKHEVGLVEHSPSLKENEELYQIVMMYANTSISEREPVLNKEETEVLINLDKMWKWIARNKNNEVCVHKCEPSKMPGSHWTDGNQDEVLSERLFKFIKWEDEVAYNIEELLS